MTIPITNSMFARTKQKIFGLNIQNQIQNQIQNPKFIMITEENRTEWVKKGNQYCRDIIKLQ